MDFIYYDLILLVGFAIFMSAFLYTKRKNLNKEGLLFLYRTKWGMKLIDNVGGKYTKTLRFLSYISVGLGYFLMALAVWLIGRIVWIYVAMPSVVRMIKVPPITPIVPYVNKFVPGVPEFYFIYWIIIIAIIAITHEFAHGIFMKRYGIEIKSTGFGFFPFFLPVFLAAFVEQDEKSMTKAKNFEQMAVLGAGAFANFLTGILFFGIMALFFTQAFVPSGVVFNDYGYNVFEIENLPVSLDELNFSESSLMINGSEFVGINAVDMELGLIALYYNSPAWKNNLSGAIMQIDDEKISSLEDLTKVVEEKEIGDEILIKTKTSESVEEVSLILEKNPYSDKAWIGIVFEAHESSGVVSRVIESFASYKEKNVYYNEKFNGAQIIYNFLWWLVLISFSVAIINLLPVGIFDGGKFFYLTILSLTRNKKIAENSFKFITYFFLFLLFLVMIYWGLAFFR